MRRNLYAPLISLFVILVLVSYAAAGSFVTFTADSLYNAKNYGEALKHYGNIASKYYNEAVRPETVNYLFGYESVKKAVINKSVNSAKVALYSFYMQALCNINLKNYAGAVNSVNGALSCFSFQKMLTPKSLSGAKTPEMVLISQPPEVINDYSAKINVLPISVDEVLKVLQLTARQRYSTYNALANTPQGPAYNELLAKYNALVASENSYAELCVNIISRDLDAQKFHSFESLVSFMKSYRPIDKSAVSTLEVSNKIIAKMTSLSLSYQGSNVSLASHYSTVMQKLISMNAYFKGYLATSGGR